MTETNARVIMNLIKANHENVKFYKMVKHPTRFEMVPQEWGYDNAQEAIKLILSTIESEFSDRSFSLKDLVGRMNSIPNMNYETHDVYHNLMYLVERRVLILDKKGDYSKNHENL